MRMIVHDFKVKVEDKTEMKHNRYPTNLFRDDEVKSHIEMFISDSKKLYLLKAIEESI